MLFSSPFSFIQTTNFYSDRCFRCFFVNGVQVRFDLDLNHYLLCCQTVTMQWRRLSELTEYPQFAVEICWGQLLSPQQVLLKVASFHWVTIKGQATLTACALPFSSQCPHILQVYYKHCTGWPFRLFKTFHWHWFQSCVLVPRFPSAHRPRFWDEFLGNSPGWWAATAQAGHHNAQRKTNTI